MAASEITENIIYRNISEFFSCGTSEIREFRQMSGGLSNTSFFFTVRGTGYVYRHPGNRNGKFVNRTREKRALETARELGLETAYLYMNSTEGWKISKYIPKFREPDYRDKADSRQITRILRTLHTSDIMHSSWAEKKTRQRKPHFPAAGIGHGIHPWDDVCQMELEIKKRLHRDPDVWYAPLKEKIHCLFLQTLHDGVSECFCHGDTYAPNWMFLPDGRIILTDWEYAGISDPGMDVGYYIADAGYGFDEAEDFIRLYLGDTWSRERDLHFKAYIAIAAWYWMVWALYRMTKEPADSPDRDNIYLYYKKWNSMAEKYAAAYCG